MKNNSYVRIQLLNFNFHDLWFIGTNINFLCVLYELYVSCSWFYWEHTEKITYKDRIFATGWIDFGSWLTSYLVVFGTSGSFVKETSDSVFNEKPSNVFINLSKLFSSGTSGSIKDNAGLSVFRKSILNQYKIHIYYIQRI